MENFVPLSFSKLEAMKMITISSTKKITIYNLKGNVVKEFENKERYNINVSDLESGLYLAVVVDGQDKTTRQLFNVEHHCFYQ